MNLEEIHIGDSTEFRLTVYDGTSTVDISGANTTTARVVTFKKPTGTYTTQVAAFVGSGTAGVCAFTATTGFLDVAGEWGLQLKLTVSNGTFYSNVYRFNVYENI